MMNVSGSFLRGVIFEIVTFSISRREEVSEIMPIRMALSEMRESWMMTLLE